MKKAINSTREVLQNNIKLVWRIVVYVITGVVAGTLIYASLDHRVENNTENIEALKVVDVDIIDDVSEVEKSLIRQEEQNVWIRSSLERLEKKLDN